MRYLMIVAFLLLSAESKMAMTRFTYKIKFCQHIRNVRMVIADSLSSAGDYQFISRIAKHYYQPLVREITQHDSEDCFNNVSLFLVTMYGIERIKNSDEEMDALYSSFDTSLYPTWYWSTANEARYWENFLEILDDLVSRKPPETFVFFVRSFPEVFLTKLYELHYKLHLNMVVVFHDSYLYSHLKSNVRGYGSGILENLPHVIASNFYYDALQRKLLQSIKNPEQNRFEFVRNVESSINTSCLRNTTIGVIYKVVDRMPYYEDWFVELMIRLENILVVKNKEMNVKFRFFIIGTIYFDLPKMVYNYEITKIKSMSDLYTWYGNGENKVFLVSFIEEYNRIFQALNGMLVKQKNAGLIARAEPNSLDNREFVKNHKYRAPFRQNNIVDVSIGDISSSETMDLLLEALIEAGC